MVFYQKYLLWQIGLKAFLSSREDTFLAQDFRAHLPKN